MTINEIQKIIRGLRDNGIAILITDHRERETLAITDRSYMIRAGKVLCHGTAEEVLEQPRSPKILLRRRPGEGRGISASGSGKCCDPKPDRRLRFRLSTQQRHSDFPLRP